MIVTFDAVIDTATVLHAPHADKVAVMLAWGEHCNLQNSADQRDEWGRAFCRHLLPFLSTAARPN